MSTLPHTYCVTVIGQPEDALQVEANNLPPLEIAPPENFGGPGDKWSPEELLLAAVADCTVLSFRAIARAAHLNWKNIECQSEGVLERIDRITRFTHITTHVKLVLPQGESEDKARRLLEKAEQTCFISRSLACELHFDIEIRFA